MSEIHTGLSSSGSPANIHDIQSVSLEEHRFRILLLDDESAIVNALYRSLRDKNLDIIRTNSGEEALEELDDEPVDLIISDMRMPQMDGAEFLAIVAERYPSTVRFLLTGYSDMSSTIAAINHGKIHQYLQKPWDDKALKTMVMEALQEKTRLDDKARENSLLDQQRAEFIARNDSLQAKLKQRTRALALTIRDLKNSYQSSLKVFSQLSALREDLNPGHSHRVAERASAIAETMGLDETQCETIYSAGLLHDIGKIGLSDHLIRTPEAQLKLTDLRELQKHAEIGYNCLVAFDPLSKSAALVKHHHERYDGKGYPDNLEGDAIPLGARILAVADEFDKLLVGNEFRQPMIVAEALNYIEHQSGKKFDPAVINALFELEKNSTADKAVKHDPNARTRVKVENLQPGMIIAESLQNSDGIMLLPANQRLTPSIITRLQSLRENYKGKRVYAIYTASIMDESLKGNGDSVH